MFAQKNVASTAASIYTFISPPQYEALLVENAHFGIDNAVRLFHVDQFDQTVGRNCGFRYQNGNKTIAVMSPRLWHEIGLALLSGSRYLIRPK